MTYNNYVRIILACLWCNTIITCPNRSYNKRRGTMLSRSFASDTSKVNIFVKLSFSLNISIYSEKNIVSFVCEVKFLSLVRLIFTTTNLVLKPFHFFRRNFSVIFNIFKCQCANCIELLKNNVSHISNIVFAPLYFVLVIVSESLSKYVLHCPNNIFRDLTLFSAFFNSFIFGLPPQSDESC
jgi:hypothetical protein